MLRQSAFLQTVERNCVIAAKNRRFEFITPELFVYYGVLGLEQFEKTLDESGINAEKFADDLEKYIDSMETVPENVEYEIEVSVNLFHAINFADQLAEKTGKKECDVPHVLIGIANTQDCEANRLLNKHSKKSVIEFMSAVINNFTEDNVVISSVKPLGKKEAGKDVKPPFGANFDFDFDGDDEEDGQQSLDFSENDFMPMVQSYTKLLNRESKNFNPLVGREDEMERTIQVLLKKQRHNVLYIGEPGVGKTAMVHGLTQKITDKAQTLPKDLNSAKIYQLELSDILAGSQFRGDFEKRIKGIMDEITAAKDARSIVYINDIHNLVGMGTDGSNDAASMMLKYMDKDNIRFIGATTFKEFKSSFEKNKALLRRFQIIEISEPTVEETIKIIQTIKPAYEKFHKVKFKKDTIKHAVELSVKYISDRNLPEKAIDLLDEAGSYREIHPVLDENSNLNKVQSVDCELISQMLTKVKKLANIPEKDDTSETKILENLSKNIKSLIYGQDTAVNQIVESVLMSKAGLSDSQKPVASFLFVGQTGVGKTEIAKVLAKELNMDLVRFDMSEYTEKHTVAKLIGSPAGYVGYEDGGLLTDAIRKTPNCVLLFDEIEKAHSDIYNIMLQIMDYASLTDNKGQKSDFKHVIIIMTSNVGAEYASQQRVGFTGGKIGDAMLSAAKKTFKPEFINRLSSIVVFNDMNEDMAKRILNKKLNELFERLQSKNITLTLSDLAKKELLKKGFSEKYGAREIDRVLNSMLNPLLMKEILFGKLKKGGHAEVDFKNEELVLIPRGK
ncbi:MAG: AAA family ATPase [Bacteroidales bacterium]|nr:AAA family ATPase [Bacteroidales bacterium]